MLIRYAYHFRLYPTREQRIQLGRQFGCVRWVYNHFLARREEQYDATGKGLSYEDSTQELAALKQEEELAWLREVHSQTLQQGLKDLDSAYRHFFEKRNRCPRFKRKQDRQSCRYPQGVKLEGEGRQARVYLPKMGWVACVAHRAVVGKLKQATVSKTPAGRYFVSLQVEQQHEAPEPTGGIVGIDLGLKHFATLSTGEKIAAPKHLRKAEKRLRRLQRRLSRRQTGSNSREKARRALARQHEKVANQRHDFLHKVSRRLVDENQVLGLEDLNVQGMQCNHHLAKSIADAGWGEFQRQLRYKGEWYGCHIHIVDRFFPSSKRCHRCGRQHRTLTLRDRIWTCERCGMTHDRDVNAALNLEWAAATAGTVESYAGGAGQDRLSAGAAPP
jgi:putative transposase